MRELIAFVADCRIERIMEELVGEIDDAMIRRVPISIVNAQPFPECRL